MVVVELDLCGKKVNILYEKRVELVAFLVFKLNSSLILLKVNRALYFKYFGPFFWDRFARIHIYILQGIFCRLTSYPGGFTQVNLRNCTVIPN